MAGSDSSELRFKKPKVKVGPQAVRQEANPIIQGLAHISALKRDLEAFKEKLPKLQQPGGGMVRLECLPVTSFLATFVVGSSESSSSAGVVKYQVKLTCGEDYPAKPPSVDWQDCPVEFKPNLEHILSTTNWNVKNPKPQVADVLNDLKTVIVEHEKKKKASDGKKNSEKASKGKNKSGDHGKD